MASVKRPRIRRMVLTVVFMGVVCAYIDAQTPEDVSVAHLRVRQQQVVAQSMPFPPDVRTSGRVYSIELRTAEQMTLQDRDLAMNSESIIGEQAGFAGMEFSQGEWGYRQMVCPVLPNHLLLQLTYSGGTGDVSVFSASIPRGIGGKVRIIPIQRRSYALFSPAPVNALTISVFNHIRTEEPSNTAPDWLTTGLCYAALAGANPRIALLGEAPQNQLIFPKELPAVLEIPTNGGAIISFTDVAAMPLPMKWTMTFDGHGKLLKATHARAPLLAAKVIYPKSTAEKIQPVLQNSADLKGKPIPAADSGIRVKLIPPTQQTVVPISGK
jgi:hypothetical protein